MDPNAIGVFSLGRHRRARDMSPRDALLIYAAKCTRRHEAEGVCPYCDHGFESRDYCEDKKKLQHDNFMRIIRPPALVQLQYNRALPPKASLSAGTVDNLPSIFLMSLCVSVYTRSLCARVTYVAISVALFGLFYHMVSRQRVTHVAISLALFVLFTVWYRERAVCMILSSLMIDTL